MTPTMPISAAEFTGKLARNAVSSLLLAAASVGMPAAGLATLAISPAAAQDAGAANLNI